MSVDKPKLKPEPTMAWDPETGDAQVYNHPSEVPEGFLDAHPNHPKFKPAPAAEPGSEMTRAEVIAALKSGGVSFNPAAKQAVLYELLTVAVKKALDATKVKYDPALPTKQLLALLPDTE